MTFNVVLKRPCLEAQFEVGSLSELAGILQDESTTLVKLFGSDLEAIISNLGGETISVDPDGPTNLAEHAEQSDPGIPPYSGKGRKSAARLAWEAEQASKVSAPEPIATPTPAEQNAQAAETDSLPDYLRRQPSPPTAPIIPPSGILAGKIIAKIDDVCKANPGMDANYVSWLAGPGIAIVAATATYDEAIAAIRMMSDDKLAKIARALGV